MAKTPGRGYSNVHAGVPALMRASLLEVTSAGMRVDYDSIETKIAI